MQRREFLKFSATGLAVVAVGSMVDWPLIWRGSRAFAASLRTGVLGLDMVEATAEMVDGIPVPMWAFMVAPDDLAHNDGPVAARIPGPVLVALEGDRIRMRLTNRIAQGGAHGFAIPGVTLTVNGGAVSEVSLPTVGGSVEFEFTAPAAGTYMYIDPLNAPVNRVLGLHGALVVLPNPVGNETPYAGLPPTDAVRRLFADLGRAAHFPGNPWDPGRNAVWVFNVVDPVKAAAATAGAGALPPAAFLDGYLPQYFTINGKSGFFGAQHGGHGAGAAAHGRENSLSAADGLSDAQGSISIRGTVGQPIVIRNLNPGLMWHSPHIHGNHIYPIAEANIVGGTRRILTNLTMLDTWTMAPGDIKDLLHPFIQPPDIPPLRWPPVQELFPLVFPMHDHNEISNTAAGGNYPQGLVTHWQIDAPFDPADPATGVITIDRADMRVKSGQLILEGRFTVPNVILDVHAGGSGGPVISNTVRVGADGRFRFRGRALKALASRFVTLMHHDPLDPALVHAGRAVALRLR